MSCCCTSVILSDLCDSVLQQVEEISAHMLVGQGMVQDVGLSFRQGPKDITELIRQVSTSFMITTAASHAEIMDIGANDLMLNYRCT